VYAVEPDGKPWRSWAALAAAVGLHAAVASLTYVTVRSPPPEVQSPAPTTLETDVEIDDTAPAAPGHDAVQPPADGEPSSERAALGARAERRSTLSPEGVPSPEQGPPSTEHGEGGYALDPTAPRGPVGDHPRVELGIGSGDWSRYVNPTARVEAPPARRPSSAAPPVSSTGGLVEALEAHDRDVGLGPEGPVVSAAHEAGHSDVAPAIGTAQFSITVMRSGGIQVELVGASSNVEGWRKVADKMAAAIKKKPPRIAGGRNGVRFGLELVAEERWPNGQVARSEGPALALTPPSFKATEKSIEDLSKRNPLAVAPPGSPAETPPLKLDVDMPGLSIKGRGKVCSYQVGLLPLGLSGGCDPSNIGARAQRVVSAKITEQSML
jgi:hypothetical protein